MLGYYYDRFFIECKHHEKGVPPEKLNSKIAWADAEKPDHLVFMVSSYLTEKSRIWLEKIRSDKPYKIHVLEEAQLKRLISQHEDIIKKFFLKNDKVTLLNDTKKNWLIHGIVPSFTTLMFLFENLDIDSLPTSDLVFLYILYYSNYSKMEQLENRVYHGINVDDSIWHIEENLIKRATYRKSLITDYANIETLSSEGCLTGNDDDEQSQYIFMSTDVLINDPSYSIKNQLGVKVLVHHRLAIYLFKRLKNNQALEILLFRNSDFENNIRFIEKYSFEVFKEAVLSLDLRKEFQEEVLANCDGMKE